MDINEILNKKVKGWQVILFGISMICAGIVVATTSADEKTYGYGAITIIGGVFFILLPVVSYQAIREPKSS